jgi:hypothetical protein
MSAELSLISACFGMAFSGLTIHESKRICIFSPFVLSDLVAVLGTAHRTGSKLQGWVLYNPHLAFCPSSFLS